MGVLALGIVWVNTLLVVAAAWKELQALAARKRRFTPLRPGEAGVGLIQGEIVAGPEPGSAFARHEVEQVGRQASGGGPVILFADRGYKGTVLGGTIRAG